ncbi:MAG: YfiT family bacillithiol transferase, partial [Saprospiraceae bacterium]
MQQDRKRYPIGRFEYGKSYSLDETRQHIRDIAKLPKQLKKMARKLSGEELETSYRRDGWTARQVIHHLADSHVNAYIRMKLAVTANTPAINPYDEVAWAEMEDAKHGPVKTSVTLLSVLHKRWVTFLHALTVEELEKGYFHPGMGRVMKLSEAIALYAWHGRHHLAHVKLVAHGDGGKAATSKSSAEKGAARVTIGSTLSDEAPAEKPRRGRKPAAAAEPKPPKAPRKPRTPKAPKIELTEAEKAARAAEIKERRVAIIAAARAARMAKRAEAEPKPEKKAKAPKPPKEPKAPRKPRTPKVPKVELTEAEKA